MVKENYHHPIIKKIIKEKQKAYFESYYHINKEKIQTCQKQYKEKNQQKIQAYQKEYQKIYKAENKPRSKVQTERDSINLLAKVMRISEEELEKDYQF